MKKNLIAALLLGVFALALPVASPAHEPQGKFVHHVFFWFKNADDAGHHKKFLAELEKMKGIETIVSATIGKPAGTPREVVDNSWTYDWLISFKSKEDWQIYNDHPVHKKFIDEAGHIWSKVQVYDTVVLD
jgi:stress responsive alpha/beta barrel protein